MQKFSFHLLLFKIIIKKILLRQSANKQQKKTMLHYKKSWNRVIDCVNVECKCTKIAHMKKHKKGILQHVLGDPIIEFQLFWINMWRKKSSYNEMEWMM